MLRISKHMIRLKLSKRCHHFFILVTLDKTFSKWKDRSTPFSLGSVISGSHLGCILCKTLKLKHKKWKNPHKFRVKKTDIAQFGITNPKYVEISQMLAKHHSTYPQYNDPLRSMSPSPVTTTKLVVMSMDLMWPSSPNWFTLKRKKENTVD